MAGLAGWGDGMTRGPMGTIGHGHHINIEVVGNIEIVAVYPPLSFSSGLHVCVCVSIGVVCVFFDIGCCSKGVHDGRPSEAVEFGCQHQGRSGLE